MNIIYNRTNATDLLDHLAGNTNDMCCPRTPDGEGGRGGGQIKIGFVEEQCFQFGVKELWRDSKG